MSTRMVRLIWPVGIAVLLLGVTAAAGRARAWVPPDDVVLSDVGGEIITDTVWSAAGSPYTATSAVIVQQGVTLTVEAGVEVRFNGGTGMFVYGALRAIGTAAEPIAFTTASAEPAGGQWQGVFFDEGSDDARSVLEHVTVSYAGGGLGWYGWYGCYSTGIGLHQASPTIRQTTVRHSAGSGLWASGSDLTLSEDVFESNGGSGVSVGGVGRLVVGDSLLRDNSDDGLNIGGIAAGAVVTVSGNTVSGNRSDGIEYRPAGVVTASLVGNVVMSNTQYAVYVNLEGGAGLPSVQGNSYGGNGGWNGVAVTGILLLC